MKERNYIRITVIIVIIIIFWYSPIGAEIQNTLNRLRAEIRVNKKHAEEMVKADLETIFGKEYAKTIKFEYYGLDISRGSSGPIPDFDLFKLLKPIPESSYKGYFYIVHTSIFKEPIMFTFSWNAENSKVESNKETYSRFIMPSEASDEFERFYLNKMGFDENYVKSAEVYIDPNYLNFDKLKLEKYDNESIFDNIKVIKIGNIVYEDREVNIENVKNKLDSLSIPISNMYSDIDNNYVGYNIQFCSSSDPNGYSSIIAHAENIDENQVYFNISEIGVKESENHKVAYDGINSNKYVSKINFKRIIKDFLDKSNNDYEVLPINDSVKTSRINYLNELKGGKLELISYKSNYNDKKVCFLLNVNSNIELLEYDFEIDNNSFIDSLRIKNRVMLVENGVSEFENFHNIKNGLWENIFILCNPQYMNEDIVLSVTDSFYKNNIKFFEEGESIFKTNILVDKNKTKVYLIKYDNLYEYDYNVEIVDNYLINNVEFVYNREYKDISKTQYENVEKLAKQYLTKIRKTKLSKELKQLLNYDIDNLKKGDIIKNTNHSIYYYMKRILDAEEQMRIDIQGYLNYEPYDTNVNRSSYNRQLLLKYGVKNVLKYCNLGDEFNLYWKNGRNYLNFIVVRKEKDKVLLLADFTWPLKENDKKGMTINYEYSNVRLSLNLLKSRLLNEIVENLVETRINNHSNNSYGINLGKDTYDKIFILSVEEMDQIKKECDFIDDQVKQPTNLNLRAFSPYIYRTAGMDTTTFAFTNIIKLESGHYVSVCSYEPNSYGSILPSEIPALSTRPAMWVKIN